MNQPPKVFVTICNIAQMPADKINQAWLDLSEKVISEFIEWLIKESGLSQNQLKSLETMLQEVVNDKTPKGNNVLDLVKPILSEVQKKEAIDKYSDLFVTNLNSFYTTLKESMTFEQKQVTDSYIKTTYA